MSLREYREYERLMHYDGEITPDEARQRVGSLHNHKKVSSDSPGEIRECECGSAFII